MSERLVDKLARALLYEGYVLYPYRPSVKNQKRWTFGGIYPPGGEEPSFMRTQCLLAGASASLQVTIRFLHLVQRSGVGEPWQEAIERKIDLEEMKIATLLRTATNQKFSFPKTHEESDGVIRDQRALEGVIELSAALVAENIIQLTVTIQNQTPPVPGDSQLSSFVSTHTILTTKDGSFISLTDPLKRYESQAVACRNVGTWPVLVGDDLQTDTLLSSPIILPDYPQLAPESPGDLFDGTEIDEILTLRILTLTDEEKKAAAATDDRVRKLLERTQSIAHDQLLKLHGSMRGLRPVTPRVGDRVRISPRKQADAMDIALTGKTATVVSIEHDFENKTHFAVTIDDDPGRDMGHAGLPGHRFFFSPDEVELVTS